MLRVFPHQYIALLIFCFASWPLAGAPAYAAQEIVLISDQSQIIKLPQAPATLIVGNPSVADVTTEGNSLFFHPRGYGLTNVLALDAAGRKLGDYLVRVIYEDSYSVSMYDPRGRRTYSCRRDCEPTMRIGDTQDFFGAYAGQVSGKNGLALGQSWGEDMQAPVAVTTTPGVPSNP